MSIAVSLFSMAGVPPLIGFFAKQSVLYASISAGYYWLSLVAILVSVVSAYYYLRVLRVIYFDAPSTTEQVGGVGSAHAFTIATLTLTVALYILKPEVILNST